MNVLRWLLVLTSIFCGVPNLLAEAKDPFSSGKHFDPAPELVAKYKRDYADVLAPFEVPRDHPDAKGLNTEALRDQWQKEGREAAAALQKAGGQPEPNKPLTLAEAVRYFNEQCAKQHLPYRVRFLICPLPGEEDMGIYFRSTLEVPMELRDKYHLERPKDTLWTLLQSCVSQSRSILLVYKNGDILICHRLSAD